MTSGVQCQTSMTTIVHHAEIGVLRDVVVEAQPGQRGAEQADVGAREDLPDRADHVPGDQHRQRDDHQHGPTARPPRGRQSAIGDAKRHLDQQRDQRKARDSSTRRRKAGADLRGRVEQIAKPSVAVPEELVLPSESWTE